MRNEQGMTLLGMIGYLAAAVVFGIIVMRVVPVYIENYTVRTSIKTLNDVNPSKLSSDPMMNVVVLKNVLINQFDINSLTIAPDAIKVSPSKPGSYLVSTKYTVTKPLIGNVSLFFDFNESEEVTVGPK